MVPLSSRPKILFISGKIHAKCFIKEALHKTNYEIIEAKTSKSGIQKVLEYSPDLIICQNELDGYSGFQIYNNLKDTLIKNGILFFIYSDKLDKEDILIGLEMGVDNFILSPVDEQSLVEKIEHQINKVRKYKLQETQQFDAQFESTPIAKFIVAGDRIEKTNRAFDRLLRFSAENNAKPLFSELFDLSENSKNAMIYRKCVAGFKTHVSLTCVPAKLQLNTCFDIHLQYSGQNGHARLLAEIVPSNLENLLDKQTTAWADVKLNGNHGENTTSEIHLTSREKEVLELSSKGLPIKQIAEELQLSKRTVEKHRSNIMKKTQTGNIVEAIFAVRKKSIKRSNSEI